MTTDQTKFAMAAVRILAVLAMLATCTWGSAAQIVPGLSYEFYDQTCPQYNSIIENAITSALQVNPVQAAGLTRILYHDCFIQGCDASLLLTGTGSEQNYGPNPTLRKESFQLVNEIKSDLEQACPNTVSCADILSLAAADALRQVNGPSITVPVGRRDGTSMASNQTVVSGLPTPLDHVTEMIPTFSKHGLTYTDLVALSGAHTLGYARCAAFSNRLSPVDPNLNANLAQFLIKTCTSNPTTLVSQDQTPNTFDNGYFTRMVQGAVLLTSDADLDLDANTVPLVNDFAGDQSAFGSQFEISFLKLSQLNVLTGSSGQIRKTCTAIN